MEIPRHWRLTRERYRLTGEICLGCGEKIFPPRDLCLNCQTIKKTPYTFRKNKEEKKEIPANKDPELH